MSALHVDTEPLRESLRDERPMPVRRRRWVLPVTIGSGLLVCGIGAGIAAQVGVGAAVPIATPSVSSSPVREVTGVPGWSTKPNWAASTSWDECVVAAGGGRFASVEGGVVIIRDADGVEVDREPVPGDPVLYAVSVDGGPAILAASGATVRVWAGDVNTSTVWELPAGGRMAVRGNGVVVTDAAGQVAVLTGAGFAPFVAPLAGAAPLAVTADGALQWASARGAVLTASAAGTVIVQAPLTPPAPGARISRWLSGGPSFVVQWTLEDSSIVLATHGLDGALLATSPTDATNATGPFISAPGATVAMLGTIRVDRVTGAIDVPDPTFTASRALGDTFYGAQATVTAVLTGNTVTATGRTPTIVPLGVLADGALLASEHGVLTIFPKTSAK